MRNSFGNIFTITSYGESHGSSIGGVVDGMPAGIDIDMEFIQNELDRRRPGQSEITTARKEKDKVILLSGVFEGKSTGTPIGFIIKNEDHHPYDYDDMSEVLRPSHADFTFHEKYGLRDYRGGGRASARITISRCVAGALAKLALKKLGIRIKAYTSQIGSIRLNGTYKDYDLNCCHNSTKCPDQETAARMEDLIKETKQRGDTVGGIISCVIQGCPAGLGEPEFNKLHAALGAAMLSINAAKGFEYGDGFAAAETFGSQTNDPFMNDRGHIKTATNHSGGIQGGISNGEDIFFRVAFKPVATLLMPQTTVDIYGNTTTLNAKGRHDPCVIPRAVPIVEAMAAITILDFYLLNKTTKI